jgi:hypothetical protein
MFPEEATTSCSENHSLDGTGCVGGAEEQQLEKKRFNVLTYFVILENEICARRVLNSIPLAMHVRRSVILLRLRVLLVEMGSDIERVRRLVGFQSKAFETDSLPVLYIETRNRVRES